jgi:hypothetical protein
MTNVVTVTGVTPRTPGSDLKPVGKGAPKEVSNCNCNLFHIQVEPENRSVQPPDIECVIKSK